MSQREFTTLEALRQDYVRALGRRVRGVASAVAAWRAEPLDVSLREHARLLAHRIGGTAGSFGLGAVGVAALEVERRIKSDDPPLDRWSWIDVAVDDLRRIAAQEGRRAREVAW